MIDIRTGNELTRRDFGKGLAAIIGAGVAPSIALGTASLAGSANGGVARGMMRNVGVKNAILGSSNITTNNYYQTNCIAMFDGIENYAKGVHMNDAPVWVNLIDRSVYLGNQYYSGGLYWDEKSLRKYNDYSVKVGNFLTRYDIFSKMMMSVIKSSHDFSIEFVCNATYTGSSGIIFYIGLANSHTIIEIRSNDSLLYRNGSSNKTVNLPGLFGDNGDVHCCITHSASNNDFKIYSKGLPVVNENDANLVDYQINTMLGVGCANSYNGYYYNGDVKHTYALRIHSDELSAQHIADNYAVDKVRFNLS